MAHQKMAWANQEAAEWLGKRVDGSLLLPWDVSTPQGHNAVKNLVKSLYIKLECRLAGMTDR
jgi:hypothetical protein